MKYTFLLLAGSLSILLSCTTQAPSNIQLRGTWRLVSGTTITKGVSTVTDYTKDSKFIKIINEDHFAFLKHDLNSPKDSSNHFDAGGGAYTLNGDQYTEHLDFYGDRNWEAKTFQFTVSISNDTLTQRGQEKVEGTGVDREIIERYVREK
ncbi:hypothetical protein ACQ86N_21345 [Puia sp. P3]|uniref:hypothetical protein n=1 Tax=Puia sp. P3 TaxID=3423952 RepID=UPI003D678201